MIVLQYIRSVIFIVLMYLGLFVIGVGGLPLGVLGGRKGATAVARGFCFYTRWLAAVVVGLRTEVRGTPPTGDVLVAAKHQSFLDILMIYSAVPAGIYIMKKELVYAPVVGWYAYFMGCIPVDRGKRGAAIKKMVADMKTGKRQGGQLMIFSQGTRVAPGVKAPYKIGTGVLYNELKKPCVPVAVNVGMFWPRRAILRKPGLAVIEFLPEIPPGLRMSEFMARIEADIETASDRLMDETGLPYPPEAQ